MLVGMPRNSWFLTIVNNRHFGRVAKTALFMHSHCDPGENVNVLSANLVKPYRADTLFRVFYRPITLWGTD
jgi:hypothetical protein